MPSHNQIQNAISLIENICTKNGINDVLFIGGYPRSISIGTGLDDVKDLEITSLNPKQISQLINFLSIETGSQKYNLKDKLSSAMLDINGIEVEFQYETEPNDIDQFLHMWGIESTPITMNLFNRDFTIDALAMPIGSNQIMDVTKRGISDIDRETISSILPPDFSVPRNPLMITKAVRLAYKYNFMIEENLWTAMKNNISELESKISPERLVIESFVLSKYDAGDMLNELGLNYLIGPKD